MDAAAVLRLAQAEVVVLGLEGDDFLTLLEDELMQLGDVGLELGHLELHGAMLGLEAKDVVILGPTRGGVRGGVVGRLARFV